MPNRDDTVYANSLEQKESFYIRKEFNSQRIGLKHQQDRRFIVLEHQYGRRDVMWKRSINMCFFNLVFTHILRLMIQIASIFS